MDDQQVDRTYTSTAPPLRRRRGQSLAEFALTLPIVLLLMFGIIEFARIFQAWVTLQNAARTAARYAVTGQVDVNHLERIADDFALSIGDAAGAALPDTRLRLCQDGDHRGSHVDFGPYSGDYESIYANYWDGEDCEPGSEDAQGLLNDIGRIYSIRDQARIGAAGLDIRIADDAAYQEEVDGSGNFVRWANDDKPGWFHVFICSSRPTLREDDAFDAVRYNANRTNLTCNVVEQRSLALGDDPQSVNNDGKRQWDAGGPGDAVEIIVTFNHPLITPLALPTYVQLQARRVMINEAFRASRVVNLPPVLGQPTNTPSNTPLPTSTSTITLQPTQTDTPTITQTSTPVNTPTPSPTPDCSLLSIAGVGFSGAYLQVSFRNDNFAPVELQGVDLEWSDHMLFPNMYVDLMQWDGETHWDGLDTIPPTSVGTSPNGSEPTWNASADTTLDGGSTSIWQVRFANGPFSMSDYFTTYDFTGSVWYFSNGCTVVYNDPEPTGTPNPTDTPIPSCADYSFQFEGFWPQGVVQFSVRNAGSTPIQIPGFDLRWVYYFNGMNLDFVSLGGVNAFDPAGVVIWNGNDTGTTVGAQTNTASGALGSEPGWQINGIVNPGDTVYMWLDFDGTSANLQSAYGAQESDFGGSRVAFDYDFDGTDDCNISQATVTPTNTPTQTFTASATVPTSTPSITYTPSHTYTPSMTFTPSPTVPTNTPSRTPIPTNTQPSTATHTPTNPPTICFDCG